jgi:hypothetical protein
MSETSRRSFITGLVALVAAPAIVRAINHQVERVFNPDRKDHHWGRRKLARDR